MKTPSSQAILVDADSFIYAAGFAAEDVVVSYDGTPLADELGVCTTLTRARKVLASNDLDENYIDEDGETATNLTIEVFPQPLENALHILNQIYSGIEARLEGYGKMHTLLSDRLTFRHTLARIKPYKGNRENMRRPYWQEAIRKHMVECRGAVWVEGLEADDLCGIFQRDDTVVAGVDKDLLTIPGSHYNWKKKEFTLISPLEADRNFYTQMLEGDKVDNIPGLDFCTEETVEEYTLHFTARRGCGPAAARSILRTADTPEEMYRRVRECYMRTAEFSAQRPLDGLQEMGVLLDMQEIGRLLFMTRELREDCSPVLWELPTEADRKAVEGL
jgi:hypothetical protein